MELIVGSEWVIDWKANPVLHLCKVRVLDWYRDDDEVQVKLLEDRPEFKFYDDTRKGNTIVHCRYLYGHTEWFKNGGTLIKGVEKV